MIIKWRASDVLKWMLAIITQKSAVRQTIINSLSMDWLEIYVGSMQRAQRPPEAIVYSDITLGLVEEFVKEGATLKPSDSSCELTNGTLDVLVKEPVIVSASVFGDCVEYYANTVRSRLEMCLVLHPDLMKCARIGPDWESWTRQSTALWVGLQYLWR
ncbi:unnamed protein product [Toxocara canis]|uniref:Cytochrome P450 n=1 Tax=Toxocara canis TaxID=6265 RepID=A0A183U7F3_TOXCA|nr:unnamed protein product [Toxocara canis]